MGGSVTWRALGGSLTVLSPGRCLAFLDARDDAVLSSVGTRTRRVLCDASAVSDSLDFSNDNSVDYSIDSMTFFGGFFVSNGRGFLVPLTCGRMNCPVATLVCAGGDWAMKFSRKFWDTCTR